MTLRMKSLVTSLAFIAILGPNHSSWSQQSGAVENLYRTPSAELAAIVDAPPLPAVSMSPKRDILLLMERRGVPSIAELAAPELRIAGIRINPRTNGPSRVQGYESLTLLDVATRIQTHIAGLPSDGKIGAVSWSPDGSSIAFTETLEAGIELWIVNVEQAQATRLMNRNVNAAFGGSYQWLPDSSGLIVKSIPANRGAPPMPPPVPPGPTIQETTGVVAAARTYQDLLKNAHDETLFEYFASSQLLHVSTTGHATPLGQPAIIQSAESSPDGKYLLVQIVHRPFSYLVPAYRFPHRIEVWNTDGKVLKMISDIPLAESIPIGRDAVRTGIRSIQWRSDVDATLSWVEAQDGGNPRREAAIRDTVFTLKAPFTDNPAPLIALGLRYAGIQWGSDDLALVNERWWSSRATRTWRVKPGHADATKQLVFDRSSEDRYNDPGSPVLARNNRGRSVLVFAGDGDHLYLSGRGASPKGDRPFLDRLDLATLKSERLWRSRAPHYESFVAFADEEKGTVLTRREAPAEPPNYVLRDLTRSDSEQITDFPHPYPQLANLTKEIIRYKRDDGVMLTATLYLPPGKTDEDGPFPMLMWAYPREFKNLEAASQMSGSPYRFNSISPTGPLAFLTAGYAILDGPTMPIIGEGDTEPNDTYVEQLVASAKAAVDEVVRRGVAERGRIAIGGHSYGAFMTANLLAHSDLFAAGIARSGAYNRTLTPFGFQAEERTFWEDPEVYFRMSPFMHANLVNEPLLLIHGEADNNSGTFPLQSKRFYSALKGHGAVARLVMLPNESHGYRARESVLHMLWEMNAWLDRYIRDAPG